MAPSLTSRKPVWHYLIMCIFLISIIFKAATPGEAGIETGFGLGCCLCNCGGNAPDDHHLKADSTNSAECRHISLKAHQLSLQSLKVVASARSSNILLPTLWASDLMRC